MFSFSVLLGKWEMRTTTDYERETHPQWPSRLLILIQLPKSRTCRSTPTPKRLRTNLYDSMYSQMLTMPLSFKEFAYRVSLTTVTHNM